MTRREQSQLLRPWHPALAVDVFATLSVIDGGDLAVTPGNAERTAAQIADGLAPVVEAGATPLVLGGDHSIVLGELRAHAERHGALGVVLLDAHADAWDSYYGERYFHGTPFRRALEEGLIAPERSLLAGMRGPLYAASDLDEPRGWGFEIVPCDELRGWPAEEYARRVRERLAGGPAFLSFDIDVLDPAFAPGTGTPEVGGLLPHEAQAFLRSLAGVEFVGYDVVGAIAYAGDFDAGYAGSVGSDSATLIPAFIGGTLLVMANPLSFGAFLGDWSRYIPVSASRKHLMLAAFGAQAATLIPFTFGLATASIIAVAAPEAAAAGNYASGLIEVTPGWFLLPVCIIAVIGGLSTGTTALYGTGLDFGDRDHLSRPLRARLRADDRHLRDADHHLHDAVGGDHDHRLHRAARLVQPGRAAGVSTAASAAGATGSRAA